MRYLCRLITPPNGVVLDPFTGSGSTGCGALLEGLRFIGIEQKPEYIPIAAARIAHWEAQRKNRGNGHDKSESAEPVLAAGDTP
jgi:site-specific DNA-methyltransferase (adenine-specific)